MSVKTYIVQIHQDEKSHSHQVVGIAEEAGSGIKKTFSNLKELWKILNNAGRKHILCKRGHNANGNKNLPFPNTKVNPNFSGDYIAFEDFSTGKYIIKLWHVSTGVVFEVTAGLVVNKSSTSKQ
jgi:hypothetical protein